MLTFEQLLLAAQCEPDYDLDERERDEEGAQFERETGPQAPGAGIGQRRTYGAYRRAIIMCDRDRAHLAFLREQGRIEHIARSRREAQAAAESGE